MFFLPMNILGFGFLESPLVFRIFKLMQAIEVFFDIYIYIYIYHIRQLVLVGTDDGTFQIR